MGERMNDHTRAIVETDEAGLLKAVVETAVDGILTIDERGTIITANPAIETIFGYSPEFLIGKNVKLLMPEPYHTGHDAYLKNYLTTDQRRIIGIGREVQGLRKSGEVFPLDLAVGETLTERGRIFTGIVRDISERKQAEEALKRERALLKAVVETAVDGIITIDEKGNVVSANPATATIFGYSPSELIGKNVRMLMPSPYVEEHDQYLHNYLTTGLPKVIGSGREVQGLRKNGEIFPLDLSVSETRTDDGRIFTGIVRDITEKKRSEQLERQKEFAERANAAKSEFLSRMSHELRTPLNGVLGFAEFLFDERPGSLNERQKEYLLDILNSGRHLLNLINDILDLAKVEAGKMEVLAEEFDLNIAIREVCAVVQPMYEKKQQELAIICSFEKSKVCLDQQKFKQILFNLVSNAVKFTEDEGRIEICADVNDGNHLKLSVKDTGIGIKPEDIERLFTEFEQIDSAISRRYVGSGLGLALTKRIVELQRGEIEVESEFGKGSTFTIKIPLDSQAVLAGGS